MGREPHLDKFFQNIRGQEWSSTNFFATAGRIWTEMGGEWGGSWTSFPDRPHLQYTGGLTLRDLQAGKVMPANARMPWEENIDGLELRSFRLRGQPMQAEAIIHDGRTFAMIRPILENLGYTVTWEETTGTVVVDCPNEKH